MQAAAHPAKVDYLYFVANPDKRHHFFTASATAFQQYECAPRIRLLMNVGLLGHPVAQSLSPRMQNAAFAARGLDWRYDAFDVEDVLTAVAALRTLGFAGANVTTPYKERVVAACDEADGDAVQHARVSRRPRLGFNTDREILGRIEATPRVRDRRRRRGESARPGSPRRHTGLHTQRQVAARRDRLRSDRERHAGPRRTARAPGRGTNDRRPRYGPTETALVQAARSAGCTVVARRGDVV